jgi:hypothetical protein
MMQRYQEPTETWEQSSVKAGDVWSASKTGKPKRDENESGLLTATLVRRLDARRGSAGCTEARIVVDGMCGLY